MLDPDELDIDKHDPDEDGDTDPDVRNDSVGPQPSEDTETEGDDE